MACDLSRSLFQSMYSSFCRHPSADFLNLRFTLPHMSMLAVICPGRRPHRSPVFHQVWQEVVFTNPQGSGNACPEEMAEEARDCTKYCP